MGIIASFRSFLWRQYWLFAALGALIISLAMPSILVLWHTKLLREDTRPSIFINQIRDRIIFVTLVEAAALIYCGPGAIILALILYATLRKAAKEGSAHTMIRKGMFRGALMSFLNFPGLLVIVLMNIEDPVEWLRIALLFIVAGASSGLWIGWQAYRSANPGTKFFPQISLGVLLLVVLSWAGLMAIFKP